MDELFDEPPVDCTGDDDAGNHGRLLASIQRLGSGAELRHEARVEPSEYYTPETADGAAALSVHELLSSLGDRAQLAPLRKRLSKSKRQKTLPAPQQKLEAVRGQRAAGYEKASRAVGRWENVVRQRRREPQLSFPLEKPPLKVDTGAERVASFTARTPLEQEIAALLGASESVVPAGQVLSGRERRALAAMSLDEALARRHELAKHRALLSYHEAKQRRQNRIKSRRYRRSVKKQMIRQHLEEFERLKVCDPEAALAKLQQLERQRVEERLTQRHRTTGRWARMQALKNKYDPEARAALAESLRIGRELKQKSRTEELEQASSGGEEDAAGEETTTPAADHDTDNPWVTRERVRPTPGEEYNADYVDVWSAQEAAKQLLRQSEPADVQSEDEAKPAERVVTGGIRTANDSGITEEVETTKKKKSKKTVSTKKGKKLKNTNEKVKTKKVCLEDKTVDEIFDKYENALKKKVIEKEGNIAIEQEQSTIKPSKKSAAGRKRRIASPIRACSPDTDVGVDRGENMDVSTSRLPSEQVESDDVGADRERVARQQLLSAEVGAAAAGQTRPVEPQLDPAVALLSVHRRAALPDPTGDADDAFEDDAEAQAEQRQRLTIAEAFADDDVLAEFQRDKRETVAADRPQDVDMALPGWGDWVGTDLRMSARKRRRLLFRAPRAARRDDQLGNVVLSEKRNEALRAHQVSELPHYMGSVAAWEASVRAPIGRTWLPAAAHSRLVQPSAVTRTGTVIPPMDESVLLRKRSGRPNI